MVVARLQLHRSRDLGRNPSVSLRLQFLKYVSLIGLTEHFRLRIQSALLYLSVIWLQLRTNNDQSGGPAGALYGFLFVWIGMLCTYASLSELASMWVRT